MTPEIIHGKETSVEEFRINNFRFGVGVGGTENFRTVAISCVKLNSFSGTLMRLHISEEYLERLHYVLTRFSKKFFEEEGIPSWTKIKFRQENGSLLMEIRLDKYTKTSTKIPCEDGLKKWKVTFTYDEVEDIFENLQEKGILTNVGDKCE